MNGPIDRLRTRRPRRAPWARSTTLAALGAGLTVVAAGIGAPAQADPVHVVPFPFPIAPRVTVADRSTAVQVRANQVGYLSAVCRPGEERIGGGFSTVAQAYRNDLDARTPADRYPVLTDRPAFGTAGWTVGVHNRTDADTLLIAHVECASVPLGTQIVQASGTADGLTAVRAVCPAGTHVTGGGWDVGIARGGDQVVEPRVSLPGHFAAGDGWQVVAGRASRSTSPTPSPVTAYAVCAGSRVSSSTSFQARFDLPGGGATQVTTGHVAAACPAGYLFSSAGFTLSTADGGLSLTSLAPDRSGDASRWGMTASSLPEFGVDSVGNVGGQGALAGVCITQALVF